jgi:gamma-glutamyl phosphate reductase
MVRLAGPKGATVLQELQTAQNAINDAQDDLRNNNILKVLQELNSAAVEVLKLNQQDSLAEETTEESE